MKHAREQSSYSLRERIGAAALATFVVVGAEGARADQPDLSNQHEQTVAAVTLPERSAAGEQQWNAARQNAVSSLQEMSRTLGDGNVEKLQNAVEQLDMSRIVETLSELSGLPRETIEQNAGGHQLKFYDANQWNGLLQRLGMPPETRGFLGAGGVLNLSAPFLLERWVNTKEQVKHITLHELLHLLTTNAAYTAEPTAPAWLRGGVSLSLLEGTTEWLALRTYQALNEGGAARSYGYHGGGTVAGFLLSKLVGEKALAAAYLTQDTTALRNAVNAAVGRAGAFEAVAHARGPHLRHRETGADMLGGEDPTALLRMVQILAERGLPYQEWLDEAGTLGINEFIHVITEERATDGKSRAVPVGVISVDDRGNRLAVRGTVQFPAHAGPLRNASIYFYPSELPTNPSVPTTKNEDLDAIGKGVAAAVRSHPSARILIPIDITRGPNVQRLLQNYFEALRELKHSYKSQTFLEVQERNPLLGSLSMTYDDAIQRIVKTAEENLAQSPETTKQRP